MFEDHENEITKVYAGGQGQEENRLVETAENTSARYGSPFNLREQFVPDLQYSVSASIQAVADAALQAGRAVKTIDGQIIDVNGGVVDGIHFKYGDLVYAEKRGVEMDAHITTMHVIVENGEEKRENYIKGVVYE